MEDRGKPNTQKLTIKDAIPLNALSEEAKNELNKIKEIKKMEDKGNLCYKKKWIYIKSLKFHNNKHFWYRHL